jgi:hypothetical protein
MTMQQYKTTMKNTRCRNFGFLLSVASCFILSLVVGSGMSAHAKSFSASDYSGKSIAAADTVITDSANEEKDQPEVVITKTKKKSKTVSQSPKAAKDAGTAIDEDDDNDMYVPYEKWRIDKFDNWGKHRKAKSSGVNTQTDAPDSTGNSDSKKGFNDKDKEL